MNTLVYLSVYEYKCRKVLRKKISVNVFKFLILLSCSLKNLHQLTYPLQVPVGLLSDKTLRNKKGCQASHEKDMPFVFHTPMKHCWCYFGGPWTL